MCDSVENVRELDYIVYCILCAKNNHVTSDIEIVLYFIQKARHEGTIVCSVLPFAEAFCQCVECDI